MKRVVAVDLFCGAGGTSEGLAQACRDLRLRVDLLAVNHWAVAVKSHKANHPWARHICQSIEKVDPVSAVPGGKVDLLVASPECRYHSTARGGRPIHDQKRASAWHILRWLELLYVRNVLIENVTEFRKWGPLNSKGRRIMSRQGELYQAFLQSIRALGYHVEERVLNASDFGDATTRKRLFIMARKIRGPMPWPRSSHAPHANGLPGWRPAAEIIDWSIPGVPIHLRREHGLQPLAPKTLERIREGIRRYWGPWAEPFLVTLRGTGSAKSLKKPVPALTAGGNHLGLVQPLILPQQAGGRVRSSKEPLPTLTTTSRGVGLLQPFLVGAEHHGGNGKYVRDVKDPLYTISTQPRIGLAQPFLVPNFGERKGQRPRTHSIDKPLPAPTSHGAGGLVEPFMVKVNHGGRGRIRSIDRPLPTLTKKNGVALVSPLLVKYYGTGRAKPVTVPVDTLTAKARMGLVSGLTKGKYLVGILFRMLQPHELAAAMSFPSSYRFYGTKEEQVKQIGNAVAVRKAKALCLSILRVSR